jgi:integrase
MTNEKAKYLQQRGKIWWIYYRLPNSLLNHPDYKQYKNGLFTQSLKTESISIAKLKRDKIVVDLNHVDDPYTAWKKIIEEKSKDYVPKNTIFKNGPATYDEFLKDSILEKNKIKLEPIYYAGDTPMYGSRLLDKPQYKEFSEEDKLIFDVIDKKNSNNPKMLRILLKKVAEKKKANGNAPKTISLIKRSVNWFLSHAARDDFDISLITFDQTSEYIAKDRENEVSGSTINGYLYGLRQIWDRAKKSKIVSGENPFSCHGISKDSESYDPFTYDEVFDMYDAADEEMKILIHAAATTGARVGELLTCEVKTPSTVDFKCWFFKFKDKGKNPQSTRVVPLHSSLDLPEGFKFSYSASVVTRDFKEIRDKVIKDLHDECSEKDRILAFHSFRSTVITYLVAEKAISEKVVGTISGHQAGSKEAGVMNGYINPKSLKLKKDIVEQIKWKY